MQTTTYFRRHRVYHTQVLTQPLGPTTQPPVGRQQIVTLQAVLQSKYQRLYHTFVSRAPPTRPLPIGRQKITLQAVLRSKYQRLYHTSISKAPRAPVQPPIAHMIVITKQALIRSTTW